MPYSRLIPIFALGLLLAIGASGQEPPITTPPADPAAATTAAASATSEFANNVMFEAINKMRLRSRIAAKLEQRNDILNQDFRLEGTYYKDTGNRMRLQLELSGLGDTGSIMVQVCTGKVLWDYQKVLSMVSYRRRDIEPILKRLADPALDDAFRTTVVTQLGLGGPEAMLTGLKEKVGFDQFDDQVVDGVASYVIGGKWKDRTGLVGANDRPLPPTAQLPPYVPSNVRLWFDKATLWPYKIEMVGNRPSLLQEDTRQVGPDGRPIGVKRPPPKVNPSKITIKYTLLPESEIKPDEQFVFTAPAEATNLVDDTKEFLKLLDQFIEVEINRKKAEAASKEGEPPLKANPLGLPGANSGPEGETSAPPK